MLKTVKKRKSKTQVWLANPNILWIKIESDDQAQLAALRDLLRGVREE